MSAHLDCLVVLRSIRCEAPGTQRTFNTLRLKNVSRSFYAHREPQQSTRFGPPRDKAFSWFKDETFLMRLPSGLGGACAPTAAASVRLTPLGH